MKRSDFPAPFLTALVDLNSAAAYEAHGETVRKAPRLLPVPRQAISADPHKLLLEPWRKNLKLYPQLYLLCGRDIPAKDPKGAKDAVLGVGLGLAFTDDGILLASPEPAERDVQCCYWYSLYSDNSQVLADELKAGVAARELVLTLESETLGTHVFDQRDLLFDPEELLEEGNSLVGFHKYDLVSLGAAGRPVEVPADRKFRSGEVIRVSCPQLGTLEIVVDDQRDPAVRIPTWTPRPYYMDTEDKDCEWM